MKEMSDQEYENLKKLIKQIQVNLRTAHSIEMEETHFMVICFYFIVTESQECMAIYGTG